jgi:hypothetical protein
MAVQLDVYGVNPGDVSDIERTLSEICGTPMEAEQTLGDVGSVVSFVLEQAPNLAVSAGLLVALVRAKNIEIEIRRLGFRIVINQTTTEAEAESQWRRLPSDP